MSTDEIKDEKNPRPHEIKGDKNFRPLNEDEIAHLKTFGLGPYLTSITKEVKTVKDMAKRLNDLCGSLESNTATPCPWDLVFDKQMMQVARCTKIIIPNTKDAKVCNCNIYRSLQFNLHETRFKGSIHSQKSKSIVYSQKHNALRCRKR
uniref:26S proteasome regulatory subunit 7-like n=1 Tax=Erigeron canadensis TaxID=72917 RepID=UPI001CB9C699|nr:26S proteasome regulatory subunit 7-like [Erigeron canadensis]